jgi:hypothetical protein
MADEIVRLRELAETYRYRSQTVGWLPLSAACGEAADQLERKIEILGAAPVPSSDSVKRAASR